MAITKDDVTVPCDVTLASSGSLCMWYGNPQNAITPMIIMPGGKR
jgi:hypothetical protein